MDTDGIPVDLDFTKVSTFPVTTFYFVSIATCSKSVRKMVQYNITKPLARYYSPFRIALRKNSKILN